MKDVRLTFKGISEILGAQGIGLIILTDKDEKRQITIPCDKEMLYQFSLRVNKVPQTNTLLPEALWGIIRSRHKESHFEIIINDLISGQFWALLCDLDTFEEIPMRASDAILLHYISRVPIYIDLELMRKQSIEYHKESRSIPLPVNTISDEILQKALDKAVKDENYELASNLRDEILRRKQSKEAPDDKPIPQ